MKAVSEKYVYPIILILPALSLLSGLALAPFLLILSVIIVVFSEDRRNTQIKTFISINENFFLLQLVLWSGLSIFWSINQEESLDVFLRVILMVIAGFIFISHMRYIDDEGRKKLSGFIIIGMIIAIILAVFELASGGVISTVFRSFISEKEYQFSVVDMNRGVCFLALMFWVFVLAVQNIIEDEHKRVLIPLAFWVIMLNLLINLSSMSATLGFLASSLVFLMFCVFKEKLNKIIVVCIAIFMYLLPFSVHKINPSALDERYESIPESAVHRLYIWNFSSEKILEKPYIGYGVGSSRYIDGGDKKIYNAENIPDESRHGWVYLPIHPHNNAINIALELGLIGLSLFTFFVSILIWKISKFSFSHVAKASAISMVIAYLSIGSTGFGVWQYWWIAAAFISSGLMLAVISYGRSENSEDNLQNSKIESSSGRD